MLCLSVPQVQKWLGKTASSILSRQIESRVSVGRIVINAQGRVMLDDIALWDRQDTLMLQAHRVAAKMEWLPLITDGRIVVANAQILSADAHFYHDADSTLNLQFLIDAFSSSDKKKEFPLDLHIGSLIIRRSAVRWDSLTVSSINMTAHLHRLTRDSISLSLKRLSLTEGHGLVIHSLVAEGQATRRSVNIDELSLDATLPPLPQFPEAVRLRLEASGNERSLDVSRIEAYSPLYSLSFQAEGCVRNALTSPSFIAYIHRLNVRDLPDKLHLLGEVDLNGNMESDLKNHRISLNTRTALGELMLRGTLLDNNDFSASLHTDTLDVAPFTLGTGVRFIQRAAVSLDAEGRIKGKDGLPEVTAQVHAPLLQLSGYTLRGLQCHVNRKGRDTELETSLDDPHGKLDAHLHVAGDRWAYAQGEASIEGFQWNREGDALLMSPTDVRISHYIHNDTRHISLLSNDIQLEASGTLEDSLEFALTFSDTLLLRKFANIDMTIPQQGILVGTLSLDPKFDLLKSSVRSQLEVPVLTYNKERLVNTQLNFNYASGDVDGNLYTERDMPLGATAFSLDVDGTLERLHSVFSWNNNRAPRQQGELDATVLFGKDSVGGRDIKLWIAPSQIVINDTTWQMHPATAHMHEGVIDVNDVRVSEHERNVSVNGRISASDTDTLTATFKDVNVAYIMDLVKFHTVLFGGNASGRGYLTGLMKNPVADAYAHVDDFTFNNTPEGQCDAHLTWGRTPNTLDIEGHVYDPSNDMDTQVSGLVVPGRRPDSRLHLDIDTRRFNLGFLNFFTQGIIEDIEGRVTGKAFVGGPLGKIDLNGNLHLDTLSMLIPYTGVRYHLDNAWEDSVLLRPGHIFVKSAQLMDEQGTPGVYTHFGFLQGILKHNSFKDLTYDFLMDTQRLLVYDMKNFDDQPFYGTLYSTGNLHLFGGAGRVQVDAAVKPEKGSSLTYSVATPGGITKSDFITYVDHSPTKGISSAISADGHASTLDELSQMSTDIRVNIDMDMTPDMRLRLIMDEKTDDRLDVGGEGRMLANFHNKGRFNLYGTYRLVDGNYRLSFHDIIRKDFTFRPGGTIVFSGNPLLASINMQAVYTVPNVSLNDLGSTSLGFNNTRVDCLMNVTGRPQSPIITFDFDLPNATEDEKRIVHSMVSTEEERNLQVIYLLGVGRFYSYATMSQNAANQTSTAMYSLMASTISQRFNQLLGNAIGSGNWNFGANLRTGETGWDNVDVEGMLSGRLFDNRLIINGNFGYRESYYTTRNVITDVDVQYLLTRNGSVALKAYNKTNDRYFVQNSFNTQGIGIQLQKEFNRFRQLFRRNK